MRTNVGASCLLHRDAYCSTTLHFYNYDLALAPSPRTLEGPPASYCASLSALVPG
ncbi:hypothetical protein C8T65DRAFT_643672 [Cerioporus squamosus]|nr:hypothetical protein C8T65DRAFT_643672 [Cerioporus squamosus]